MGRDGHFPQSEMTKQSRLPDTVPPDKPNKPSGEVIFGT